MGRAIASVFAAQIVFFVPPWPPTRSRLLTASSKLNGPPRRLGLVPEPEPPLALRGLLDPTTPSAPRPSEFRPEDSISLITSVAHARLDCSRAFPSQPRCRLKASSRQRRLGTSSPNRHLDEREDGQPNPEILWNPQTRANWALSQILAQSLILHTRAVGFKQGSQKKREVTTVAGGDNHQDQRAGGHTNCAVRQGPCCG